ncbi:hypothetical protein WME73_37420 [Sorangium sp. So ce302]|uniref:hypothetical protein n=1 Tax=unclassified Sorangium TaxID=2621164 RepID=UPI003F5F9548
MRPFALAPGSRPCPAFSAQRTCAGGAWSACSPTGHYDEPALAALTLHIALTNLFNRVNVTTRQIAGSVKWEARADNR